MSKYLQQTTKKTKIVGTQTFINRDTGEIEEMQVVSVEDRDFNFHKIWMGHVINSLDLIGNQKVRFVNFLFENMDSENRIIMTMRQMSDKSKIGLDTVRITIKALKNANFLKTINQGAYQINPDIIFKGSMNRRLNVLYTYNTSKEPYEQVNTSIINTGITESMQVVAEPVRTETDHDVIFNQETPEYQKVYYLAEESPFAMGLFVHLASRMDEYNKVISSVASIKDEFDSISDKKKTSIKKIKNSIKVMVEMGFAEIKNIDNSDKIEFSLNPDIVSMP